MAEQENNVAKKLSGSPLSPDQPIWKAPGRAFFLPASRYLVHSSVVIFEVTPTLAQSAWISSAAREKFGLYGRVRSEAHRSMLVTPLSARIFLAASGPASWNSAWSSASRSFAMLSA